MANLSHIRYAKSASKWTSSDLLAYNIRVSSQSPEDFYGQPLPAVESLSSLDPNLLSGTIHIQGLSEERCRFLGYLYLASRANSNQQSAVDDLTKEILHMLGYEKHGLILRSYCSIPLLSSGDPNRSAQTCVCLAQGLSAILLVVQNKTIFNNHDPESQVIAEAIATFQYNHNVRAQLDKPKCDSMTIPCITMIGTQPTFYLVPVTQELSEAVATGQYPLFPTVVKKCAVTSNSHCLSESMQAPDFRQVALQHFTAFCTLAEAHWSAFMLSEVPIDQRSELDML